MTTSLIFWGFLNPSKRDIHIRKQTPCCKEKAHAVYTFYKWCGFFNLLFQESVRICLSSYFISTGTFWLLQWFACCSQEGSIFGQLYGTCRIFLMFWMWQFLLMQRHFDWLEDIRQQAAALSKRSAKEPFLLPKVSKLGDPDPPFSRWKLIAL